MTEKYEDIFLSPIDSPEQLDRNWSAYEETKDAKFILKIISVLDWEDKVRKRLEVWFPKTSLEERNSYLPLFSEWLFPMNYKNLTIDGPVDLDIQVALLAKAGKLKFNELPVPLEGNELVSLAMKSAALWSLVSMAKQNPEIARICDKASRVKGGAAREHLAQIESTDQNSTYESKNCAENERRASPKWWKFWIKKKIK
ncbi:hypothetical protein [Seonamhaeicola sp.]|uniref:hypothetical protein n=1 Tax=Seonamhaeicola sp. TaxID=1912245 RepID=UPI00262A52A0|nr:hypothetical protein [Seonamhaeicola sp.]